jgi:capsule polysaccharide export protein KpsE/RkpR
LRIQLINEQLQAQGEVDVDIDSLKKSLAQIKTDLGDFQAMKGNASNAMNVIQNLRDQIEALERKLKRELKDAEALLE